MIRVITFDLDNTLWDVEPVLLRAEQVQYDWLKTHRPAVSERFDMTALRDRRIDVWRVHPELAHHISELRRVALYEVQVHCGYSEAEARQGARDAFDAFLEVRHQVEPYEEALEVLETLAQRYTLGALTNGNADVYKADIGEYFDFAFSAEQVGASKPDPHMFEASLRETGASPAEVVHVGDSPQHDIAGARQVGMHTVWMNYPQVPWPGGDPADEEVHQLAELPAAVERIAGRLRAAAAR
ncbi:MAG: HAD family hydrolase [Halieaceae bacterium]|jgi:putative hydrolase of the HAD superfamily|nr:HAD family hydrolase [Halieaceae bacterium]